MKIGRFRQIYIHCRGGSLCPPHSFLTLLNLAIEEIGTGTLDMIRRCRDANLREPEFTDSGGFKTTIWRGKKPDQINVQPESLPGDLKSKVLSLLTEGPLSRSELSEKLGHKKASGQLYNVIRDLLDNQLSRCYPAAAVPSTDLYVSFPLIKSIPAATTTNPITVPHKPNSSVFAL